MAFAKYELMCTRYLLRVQWNYLKKICIFLTVLIGPGKFFLKGLSHEINFKNVDENGQILALLRAAAGF
jgi:hypothetical protein